MARITHDELFDMEHDLCQDKYRLICDDNHAHNFECFSFETEEAKAILRLIKEVKFYKKLSENMVTTFMPLKG